MDQKHAGEPIGCLALIVGLVALGVAGSATDAGRRVLHSVSPALAGPPVTSAPAADASDTAPHEAVATDLAALADEARRLRDERMSVRKERMLGIAARHVEGGRRQYHRISLRNTCRYAMAVALHYRDLDDSFVTRGWWEVAPGADVLTDAMTRERVFYVYAENQSVGRTLEADTESALSLVIGDEKFDQLDGEPRLFPTPRTVSFGKRDAGSPWSDAVETFECPVEEAPPKGTVARAPTAGQGPRTH